MFVDTKHRWQGVAINFLAELKKGDARNWK
jgi:hypothetical protein